MAAGPTVRLRPARCCPLAAAKPCVVSALVELLLRMPMVNPDLREKRKSHAHGLPDAIESGADCARVCREKRGICRPIYMAFTASPPLAGLSPLYRQVTIWQGWAFILSAYLWTPTAMTPSETDPTEPLSAQEQQEQDELATRGELMLRKGVAFETLNKRIARLAIALGLELDTDVGLREALEPVDPPSPHAHAFQEELRGLLTLRYQMEKQLVDEVGSEAMHRMVLEVEQHMERMGFKPGVDGIHEHQLFDAGI